MKKVIHWLLAAKTHYPLRNVLQEEQSGKCVAMFKRVKGA